MNEQHTPHEIKFFKGFIWLTKDEAYKFLKSSMAEFKVWRWLKLRPPDSLIDEIRELRNIIQQFEHRRQTDAKNTL